MQTWLNLYRSVRALEDESLERAAPDEVWLREYRSIVGISKSRGQLLLAGCIEGDARLHPLGLSRADLAACVREIGDLDRALGAEDTPEFGRVLDEALFAAS